jgi:hypothetical protein
LKVRKEVGKVRGEFKDLLIKQPLLTGSDEIVLNKWDKYCEVASSPASLTKIIVLRFAIFMKVQRLDDGKITDLWKYVDAQLMSAGNEDIDLNKLKAHRDALGYFSSSSSQCYCVNSFVCQYLHHSQLILGGSLRKIKEVTTSRKLHSPFSILPSRTEETDSRDGVSEEINGGGNGGEGSSD